jgi:glycosyltransferase involved in cell wall biosynthesis
MGANLQPPPKAASPSSGAVADCGPVSVSVIVPFRDPGRSFEPLLRSLVDQRLEGLAEIIAVDNGSTDGARAIAGTVRGRWPIRVVDAFDRANASYARNVGARASRGSKLVFADADDELAPGYLAAMSMALDVHPFVTSRVDTNALNEPWVRDAHGAWQDDGVVVFYDFLPGSGPNVGIDRQLFQQVGGYPEEFAYSQDIAFCWRVQLAGAQLHFVPEAVYRYRHRTTLGRLFGQTLNWGKSNVHLYRTFAAAGMRRRSNRDVIAEWQAIVRGLAGARSRNDAAPYVVRLGQCVGRLIGSLRYRRFYL